MKTDYGLKTVAFSPTYSQDNTIYAGGFEGVLRSVDRGATWTNIAAGMSHTNVREMSIGQDTGRLHDLRDHARRWCAPVHGGPGAAAGHLDAHGHAGRHGDADAHADEDTHQHADAHAPRVTAAA